VRQSLVTKGDLFDPPAIVRPAEDLAALATAINAEHGAALAAARSSLEHAKAAGEMLIRAKKQCCHGKWLPWLKANVKFSERTARGYMSVARRWDEVKSATVADLSLRDALTALARGAEEPEAEDDGEIADVDEPPNPYAVVARYDDLPPLDRNHQYMAVGENLTTTLEVVPDPRDAQLWHVGLLRDLGTGMSSVWYIDVASI
jgi:hypothetical protein